MAIATRKSNMSDGSTEEEEGCYKGRKILPQVIKYNRTIVIIK
jgi:hypothetical protein